MADAVRELRIRYVLDKAQFDAAAKGVNQSIKDTGKHLDDGTQSALNLGKAMLGIVGVQVGMGAVHQVVSAIGNSMQEAAEYTKRVAEGFGATRDMMREIAAIAGKGLTNQFAADQLDVTRQAQILTPQEMTGGMLAFQQYGSAYIGDEKAPGSRISQAQLNELLPSVFAGAKIQGIEQEAAGTIFAKIVQALPAHSKTSDYKDTFAKVLEMAKNSAGSATLTAKNLAPFLSENVGEGMAFPATMEGLMSATKVVSTVSESNPEEAGTYSRAMIKDLDKIDIKGKDNDFGIDEDMTVEQKLAAIAGKWKAETGGKVPFKKWYSQKQGGRMGNVQATAALSTLIAKGVNGGFFAAMEDKAAKVDGSTLDAALAEHLKTEGGQADASKASVALGEAERGLDWSPVEAMKLRAKDELTRDPSHPFETWRFSDAMRSMSRLPINEQLVYERALEDAMGDAREAGVGAIARSPQPFNPVGVGSPEGAFRNEIKRLIDLTAEANAQRARQVPAVPQPLGGKPTVAPVAPR